MQYVHDEQMDHALTHAAAHTLIVPVSFGYPAIDSVLVIGAPNSTSRRYLFIQVTIARTQTMSTAARDRLNQMLGICEGGVGVGGGGGSNRAAIAFFVPPATYDRFKPQKLSNSDVYQFKMCI